MQKRRKAERKDQLITLRATLKQRAALAAAAERDSRTLSSWILLRALAAAGVL